MWWNKDDEKKIINYQEYPYLVYGRVSSQKDEQVSSLENQIDICRDWLERNDFEWNEKSIVIDNGITGTVLLDRAAMQLILKKAENREIKMVIFKSIHRLARDMRDSLEIREILLAHNVRVVTIEEGYDSLYEGKNDMKFEMFAMFAAQQPKTMSVSISSAMSAKVRRGERVGPAPFGYKVKDKKLIINEEEASTIKQIFKWYNEDGYGFKRITNLLNEELKKGTVSSPRRRETWQITSVQRIIGNPVYCGVFIHNRYAKVKIGGRKKQIQNPREKWIIHEDHHPAIISRKEWEKANSKQVSNKKQKITPWNEFRGMMKCSVCGSNMVVIQSWKKRKDGSKTRWRYLKCSAYRRAGVNGCVNHTPILYEDFRKFVLERVIEKGHEISLNFQNNLHKQKQQEIRQLESRIKLLDEKSKGLIDLYLEDKLISKAEFQLKRKEYNEEVNKLNDRLFLLNQDEIVTNDIQNIQEAFQQLKNEDQDLHHAFIEIIDHIVVHPDGKLDIKYTFDEK